MTEFRGDEGNCPGKRPPGLSVLWGACERFGRGGRGRPPARLGELPDAEVEVRGEGHPDGVREQEPCGQERKWEEGGDRGDDHGEEEEDLGVSGAGAVEREEKDRPDGVENKLYGEEDESGAGGGPGCLAPDEPGAEGHHQVESGPNGGEDQGWGRPGRAVEGEVPGFDGAAGSCSSDRGRDEAGEEEGEEREPGLAIEHAGSVNG